jgi:IS5 family transposase
MSQRSFASAEYAMKKKRTRREKFLSEMERIVPWMRLIGVIEPLYPTSGRVGRQPIGVAKMLRMYCLQQWYGLADEALEDALYDSQALRSFAGIDLAVATVPDATTVLNFRHWLEEHDPGAVRRGRGDAGGARPADAPGHDCRCHDHRRAAFN